MRPKPLTKAEQALLLRTPDRQISSVFSGGARSVRWLVQQKQALRKAQPVKPVSIQIEEDARKRIAKSKLTEVEKKYKASLLDAEAMRERLALALELQDAAPAPVIVSKSSGRKKEMVPIILSSDTHVGETVLANKVGGVNQYNRNIVEQRYSRWAQNVVRMIRLYRDIRTINRAVMALLGDLGTGNIHTENLEDTWCSPVAEAMFAQSVTIGAIEYILEHGDLETLQIVCAVGNHMRITQKPHHQNEVENSLELFVYAGIAQYFKNDPRVHVTMPDAYLSYIDVFGLSICYHHGHAIKYQGGIGGLAVPFLKYIHRTNTNRRADLHLVGHFHQLLDLGRAVVNGSMIGYNAYAMRHGFELEKPVQAMVMIDSHYGKAPTIPIWCDE